MQIILLEKVANLGNLGEVVRVRDGYARNYLIPKKIARRATETALKEFEARRAELEKVQAEKLAAAQSVGEKLAGISLTVSQKAGVDGRLFGSVTNMDVVAALAKEGFTSIEKSHIRLPDGSIKATGEYPVRILLHTDVVVDVTVVVRGEMV